MIRTTIETKVYSIYMFATIRTALLLYLDIYIYIYNSFEFDSEWFM